MGNIVGIKRVKVTLEYLALDDTSVISVVFDSVCACGSFIERNMGPCSVYSTHTEYLPH